METISKKKEGDNLNFIIIMGPSGCGKTALCKRLYESYGLCTAFGHTTRPPREEDEWGIIYENEDFFEQHQELGDICIYTEFHGNKYCALKSQITDNDIYITDKNGIDSFFENYDGEKEIKIIYLDVPDDVLYERLVKRDGEEKAQSRIKHDKIAFKDAEKYADFILTELNLDKLASQVRQIWKYGRLRSKDTNLFIRKE